MREDELRALERLLSWDDTEAAMKELSLRVDRWREEKHEQAKFRALSQTEKEKIRNAKKIRELRDRYRNTVCVGCHNNRYNFQSDGNGWDAPTSGEGCWSLSRIKRGVCSAWRRNY